MPVNLIKKSTPAAGYIKNLLKVIFKVCQQGSKTYFSVAGYKINEKHFLMLICNKALNYLSGFEYLIS
jgi:hypothetical protein